MKLDLIKEEIREKVDPVSILEYCGLDFSGGRGEVRLPCPIHKGNKSNFSWDLNTGIWTCWSHHCGEDRGVPRDLFLFMQLYFQINFMESLKILAGLAGLSLDETYDKERIDQFKIEKWLRQKRKRAGKENRQLDEEILESFSLDVPPYLTNRGYSKSVQDLFEVRYATEGEFKNRIVLPIRDDSGNLIGFSGRLNSSDSQEIERYGKYKNMLDFSKGVLYGLDKSVLHLPYIDLPIPRSLVLTEGQLDVLRSWDYGLTNVVASMGTSLLPEQIELIIKYTSNVVLAYDGDMAGWKAQKRVYEQLKSYCSIWFLDLPEGKDLGDLTFDEMWQLFSDPKSQIDYLPKLEKKLREKRVG